MQIAKCRHIARDIRLPSRKPQADALRESAERHDAVIAEIRKRLEGV